MVIFLTVFMSVCCTGDRFCWRYSPGSGISGNLSDYATWAWYTGKAPWWGIVSPACLEKLAAGWKIDGVSTSSCLICSHPRSARQESCAEETKPHTQVWTVCSVYNAENGGERHLSYLSYLIFTVTYVLIDTLVTFKKKIFWEMS